MKHALLPLALLPIALLIAACASDSTGSGAHAPDSETEVPSSAAPGTDPSDGPIDWGFLAGAEPLTIRRLGPNPGTGDTPGPALHGYPELAVADLHDKAQKAELMGALRRGVEESDGTIARCFVPRHAITAAFEGATTDLLICFECYQIKVIVTDSSGRSRRTVPVTDGPREDFERLFTAAGI